MSLANSNETHYPDIHVRKRVFAPRIAGFHLAVFLSAFLLFQIQPLIAKAILPTFGGSYLVWGTCMVFFQGLLLAGYAWAHGLQRRLGVRRYAWAHWLVLLAPLAFVRLDATTLTSIGEGALPLEVARLLAITVGVPFFTLSMGSLILQRWLAASDLPQRDNPYVLYSASNVGSILALLSYPLVIEPFLTLGQQWRLWWIGYGMMLAGFAICTPWRDVGRTSKPSESMADAPGEERIGGRRKAGWLALGAAGSATLIAFTNSITFDIASAPLLWVLPLVAYLLTFVLLFKRRPWNPGWMRSAFEWAIPLQIFVFVVMQLRLTLPLPPLLAIQLAMVFVVCMRVHGRLVESRPSDMHHLTTFYVLMSLGSFLGSLVISWLLPLTTDLLLEVPFALALAVAALMLAGEAQPGFASAKAGSGAPEPGRPAMKPWHIAAGILTVVAALTAVPWAAHGLGLPLEPCIALVALPLMLAMRGARLRPALLVAQLAVFMALIPLTEPLALGATAVKYHRNYYGIYKIFTQNGLRYLQHGSTQHGRQFIEGPRRATPQSYYHPSAPIGEFLTEPGWAFGDIAMVGLGTGAMAAYMGEGQRLTVLELDPDNLGIAEREFGYLAQAREAGAELEFVFGDGRINLAAMPAASYDLLVIDAFSSGAIPVHMLTVEALEQYFRVLRPDGVLLMHISNKYLSLKPLVASLAGAQGVPAYYRTNLGSVHENANLTYWMALTRDNARQAVLGRRLDWTAVDTAAEGLPRPWTDHYSNLPGLWFRK